MNETKFNEDKSCYCDMYGDYERRRCNYCADKENKKKVKKKRKRK